MCMCAHASIHQAAHKSIYKTRNTPEQLPLLMNLGGLYTVGSCN